MVENASEFRITKNETIVDMRTVEEELFEYMSFIVKMFKCNDHVVVMGV